MIQCFLAKPSEFCRVYARRFVSSRKAVCPLPHGYHDEMTLVYGRALALRLPSNCWTYDPAFKVPPDSPQWPSRCACGYEFAPEDERQTFTDRLYRRVDTGELIAYRELPPGAMWVEDWLPLNFYWDNKTDGHLQVMTPGGTWNIDSRASNCTMPDDRTHRCWVRHGEPPNVHVDKNGHTCAAGAGSIVCGNYHGFLQNGHLTASL